MADNNLAVGSPIPQGAQIGEAQASPQSAPDLKPGDAIPQGAQIGGQEQQQGSQQPAAQGGSFMDSVSESVGNIAHNFAGAATDTAMGLGELGHKAIHAALPEKAAEVLSPNSGMQAERLASASIREQKGNGLEKFVGYGGETLLEFMTGEEAMKGLSLAQKMKYGSQVMTVLEQSPKLMEALKQGASLMKVADQLGPAEREILRRFPAIARRIAVDSATAGTVQGAQTYARTGDAGGALKEGAEMAAGSGAIGAIAEPVAARLSEGGEAAKTINSASSVAEKATHEREVARNALEQSQNALQAPGKRATTDQVRGWLKQADDARHDMMEVGEQNLKERLQGESIPAKEAPMAEHAQALLDNPPVDTSGEHEVEREAKAASRDLLHPRVQKMLEMIASGEKPVEAAEAEGEKAPVLYDAQGKAVESGEESPTTEPIQDWNVDNLIGARKAIRKLSAQFQRGDINRRVLGKLMEGVDETFQALADQSGDSQAGADYQNLRQVYKTASDQIERSRFVQDLMNEKTGQQHSDFGKVLMSSGDRFEDRLENLRSILNSKQMAQVSEGFAKNLMDEGPDALLKLSPDRIDKVSQLVGSKNMQELGGMVRNVMKADGASKLFSMTPTSLDKVEKWVGKQGMKDLTVDGMRDLFAQSTDAEGNVDPDKFLDSWKTFKNKPAYRRLLDGSQVRAAARNVIEQMQHSSDFKKLVEAAGMAPAAAAGVGSLFFLNHLGPLAELMGAGSMVLGFSKMKDFMKKLADSPKLWEITAKLDNAAKNKAVQRVKETAKYGTGKGLKYVLGGASSALGGQ